MQPISSPYALFVPYENEPMSHPGNEELRERLFEDALGQVEREHPELTNQYEIEDKAAEIAEELFNNEVYFSYYGHPSLTVQERNRY